MRRAVVFTACDTKDKIYDDIAVIKEHWSKQIVEYEKCEMVGLVFIFITDGYKGILAREDSWIDLDKERRMRGVLNEIIEESNAKKMQIVGVEELIPTMSSLERKAKASGSSLAQLLLAGEKFLYYDSPKIIEAIIRIARGLRHESELIFRMDADVRPNNTGFIKLLDHYDTLPAASRGERGVFLFSGGYQFHSDPDLLNDFALRTTCFAPPGSRSLTSSNNDLFNVAQQWMGSVKEIGADPYDQIISGAGLCMSPFAVATLPPFSNMEQLIVWIDDHLKNLLHEALGHFKSSSNPSGGNTFRYCPEAKFEQDRYPSGVKRRDIEDKSVDYLKRLVRGCLMDALIQHGYSQYVQMVLTDGIKVSQSTLEQKMKPIAQERLGKIVELWNHPDYENYIVGKFAGSTLVNEGPVYIDEVINDLGRYLDLLEKWNDFVGLIEHINPNDPKNSWLFKQLVK